MAGAPLAFIVAAPTAAPGCDELRAFLDGKVPKWWIPERWSFVSEIPRTSVGKYDKKLLRIRHRAEITTYPAVTDSPRRDPLLF